ncbi:MAG TPA: aspartate dehydrogenase domain-containing protein [Rhizobiaceae bacterium]|nr:aspartate dehydrogenase domain-containing protein [Rhizobiaceae bacterium]
MSDKAARLPRVGIIGGGTVAAALVEDIQRSGVAEIGYVLVSSLERPRSFALPSGVVLADPEAALGRDVDLVVEAALPDVLSRFAPRILRNASLCGFSCTALAEPETLRSIEEAVAASGFSCYVPHGAVLALDGLADGRDIIETVTVTTTKSGKSFGVDPSASGVIYEGPAREACRRFPRNVNVHAAIAMAGIGFDRTFSRIVAVPEQATMEHRIEVQGKGLEWDIRLSSRSLGGVTGSYTPASAVGSVRRILAGAGVKIA